MERQAEEWVEGEAEAEAEAEVEVEVKVTWKTGMEVGTIDQLWTKPN